MAKLTPAQRPQKAISADTIIESKDHGRVVIEHAANVSLDKTNHERHSLWHHVYAQAELYQYALRPCTAWVIHWTTVKNGNPQLDPNTVKYWFPTSDTVKTVYIYHYDNFCKAEIWTSEDHKEDIETPWPPATISKRKRNAAGSLSSPHLLFHSIFFCCIADMYTSFFCFILDRNESKEDQARDTKRSRGAGKNLTFLCMTHFATNN